MQIESGKHLGKILIHKDGLDIIECTTCGFKHVYPLPNAKQLENFYKEEFYSIEKPLSIQRQQEDIDWLNLQYSDRYATFEQESSKGKTLLDIGSGPGFFLKYGKDKGWNVKGIEPSTQAFEHASALGVEVINAFFNESLLPSIGKYDVIHASLVLEHVPNPKQILEMAKSCLKPGGILCVTVPNDFNPFQEALVELGDYKPWWVVPKHHLNYFTPTSLSHLLTELDLDVFLTETTFPMDLFLLMGDAYVGNDELGRSCHKKRMNFELNLNKTGQNQTKRKIYQALASLDIGREICIYARNRN